MKYPFYILLIGFSVYLVHFYLKPKCYISSTEILPIYKKLHERDIVAYTEKNKPYRYLSKKFLKDRLIYEIEVDNDISSGFINHSHKQKKNCDNNSYSIILNRLGLAYDPFY